MNRRAAHRSIVWPLLLALVLYGYSGTLLQMLGPAHRHVRAEQVAPESHPNAASLRQAFYELLRPVRAWRDALQAQAHSAGTRHSHTPANAHTHAHNQFERHHHDTGDHTVLALDGGAAHSEALADGAAAATAGSATLPFGLGFRPTLTQPTASPLPWPPAPQQAWVDAQLKLLERPPRA